MSASPMEDLLLLQIDEAFFAGDPRERGAIKATTSDWSSAKEQLRREERLAFEEYVQMVLNEARRDSGQTLIEQARRNWQNIVVALRDLGERPTDEHDR